jgi:tungstate transport system permease protein
MSRFVSFGIAFRYHFILLRFDVRGLGVMVSSAVAGAKSQGNRSPEHSLVVCLSADPSRNRFSAVTIVVGNIEGRTRVLTTAIVLETSRGNFDIALALGFILLGLSFITTLIVVIGQGKVT